MAVDSFFEDASRKRKRAPARGGRQAGLSGAGGRGKAAGGRAGMNGASRGGRPSSGSRVNGGSNKGKGRAAPVDAEDSGGEELESGDEDDESGQDGADLIDEAEFESEEEADARETPAQKRLRLAQQYLDDLRTAQEEQGGFDAADLERDLINDRLQKDVLEVSGKLHLRIADTLSYTTPRLHGTSNRIHRQPVTCAIASEDCKFLYTTSKDGSLAKWDISTLLLSSPALLQPQASTSAFQPHSNQPNGTTTSLDPRKITKLDFIPKKSAGRNVLQQHQQRKNANSKGKAAIPRNQPSQDDETYGHTSEVYTLALTADGTRLASGGKDRRIGVWDVSGSTPGQGCKWLRGLRGHKDTISSLKFRLGTTQLYTAAFDRTVKVYDVASLAYIETLFGHQDKIHDIGVLRNELAVTAGGRDKTLRYWKVKDETQLVFRAGGASKIRRVLEGGLEDADDDEEQTQREEAKTNGSKELKAERKFIEGSVDCTAMLDDTHFVSGGDSGTISLWSTSKKKPIFSVPLAHGLEETLSETEGLISNPRWIVSLAALPFADLFASGSWDGFIRLWKISEDLRSFTAVAAVPALGHVNSLQLLQSGSGKKQQQKSESDTQGRAVKSVVLVAALGQEHKFGRWNRIAQAKNQALVAVLEQQKS